MAGRVYRFPEDAGEVPPDVLANLFFQNLDAAGDLYLKTKAEGKSDFVVVVDALRFQTDDPRGANWKADAHPNGNKQILLYEVQRDAAFAAFGKANRAAAIDLVGAPAEASPFVVVVVSREGARIEKLPEPRPREMPRDEIPAPQRRAPDECDMILEAGRATARDEYVKARDAGMRHPVIVLCPPAVYRLLRPGKRHTDVDAVEAEAKEAAGNALLVIVEEHAHLYKGLRTISPGAAGALGKSPHPDKPFRIVVITRKNAKVVADPVPETPPGRRVLRSVRERVEMGYLKSVRQNTPDPVALVDARGQVTVTVDTRLVIAQMMTALCVSDGGLLLQNSCPEAPFTIVVLTGAGVEIFHEPSPE